MAATAFAAETLLPENFQFTLAWDKPDEREMVVGFKLYSTQNFTNQVVNDPVLGPVTNKVWVFSTNALLEIRNFQSGSNYLYSAVPGFPKGTNAIALSSIDAVTNESALSEPLIIRTLGKPSAPQGIRKL